jgi:BolA protein
MQTIKLIKNHLFQLLMPDWLEVVDESSQHRGHGGFREGEVTHIRIRVVSALLEGLPRVQQHQKIYGFLQPFPMLHAIAIEVFPVGTQKESKIY